MPDVTHARSLSDGNSGSPAFDSFMASVIPGSEIRKRFLADLGSKLFSEQSLTQSGPHPDTHA